MAALIDQPIMIFHVSTAEAPSVIRRCARAGAEGVSRNLPAISLSHRRRSRQARAEGAKWMCTRTAAAPPTGSACEALALGDLQTVSSDPRALSIDRNRQIARRA